MKCTVCGGEYKTKIILPNDIKSYIERGEIKICPACIGYRLGRIKTAKTYKLIDTEKGKKGKI